MDNAMRDWINAQNLVRFERKLAACENSADRVVLVSLLDQEREIAKTIARDKLK
jgi:hypothetical protein